MLLGLAGGFLKSLGGKKKKKKTSGEEMANNITNKPKDKNLSIAVREKQSIVKGADLAPLKDIRDDMKQSSGKNKDPLNLALDGIDNSLFGIIDTLTETNAIRKKLKSEENKEEQLEKKNLRERMLEGASGLLKGSVKMVKRIGGKTLDNLMNFLTWTLLGTLVNFIVENWKSIREQIEKVMEQLKEVFEKLKPILIGIKNIVMWLGTTGWDWISKLNTRLSSVDDTQNRIKEIEKLMNDAESIEDVWKGTSKELDNFMKELREAKNEEEKSKVMKKYMYLFDKEIDMRQNELTSDITKIDGKYNISKEEIEKRIIISEKNLKLKKENIDKQLGLGNVFNIKKGLGLSSEYKTMENIDKDLKNILKELKEKETNTNYIGAGKDIQSYFVGIDDYSDDFEESSIILSSEGEGGSMNNGSKTPMFFGGSSDGLNIEDLYKIKINQ
jgi:hypothetical protein